MAQLAEELKTTYKDILSLGESNQRIELFDGEVIMSAMPTLLHQQIATNLTIMLGQYVKSKRLGVVFGSPVDVVLTEVIVLQPDVSFLSHDRVRLSDGKKLMFAPDLVVEILSESTEERDRTFKFREYAKGGAKEYWLISPEKKRVEVYENSERGFQLVREFSAGDTLITPLFKDAAFSVAEIFP
jgi:Uma2 family endonuclease